MAPHIQRPCPLCNLNCISARHVRRHLAQNHFCNYCDYHFTNLRMHQPCLNYGHIGLGAENHSLHSGHRLRLTESALDFSFSNFHFSIPSAPRTVSVEAVFRALEQDLTNLIRNLLIRFRTIQTLINLQVRLINNFTQEQRNFWLSSEMEHILNPRQIKRWLFRSAAQQIGELSVFTKLSSSWSVVRFLDINVKVARRPGLRVGCFIELPKCYKNKQGILNLKTNTKNLCFPYLAISVYTGVSTTSEAKKMNQYKQFMNMNWDEDNRKCRYIDFSMLDLNVGVEFEDLELFEATNSEFSINLFCHDDKDSTIYPVKIVDKELKYHMDLLLLEGKNYEAQTHFALITDFDRFMTSKTSRNIRRFCNRCLISHQTESDLSEHLNACEIDSPQRLVFPKETYVTYKLLSDQATFPCFVCADFETYAKKLSGDCYTEKNIEEKHVPISVAYLLIEGENVAKKRFISGEDCDRVRS